MEDQYNFVRSVQTLQDPKELTYMRQQKKTIDLAFDYNTTRIKRRFQDPLLIPITWPQSSLQTYALTSYLIRQNNLNTNVHLQTSHADMQHST